jgi:hypothetical protein
MVEALRFLDLSIKLLFKVITRSARIRLEKFDRIELVPVLAVVAVHQASATPADAVVCVIVLVELAEGA